MKCRDVIQALLEADREELEGRGAGPLAEHVRTCSSCRSVARAVLVDEADLARELTTAVARPNFDEILDQAETRGHAPASERPIRRDRPRLPRRAWTLTLFPLAAAAALATIFFTFTADPTLPGPPYHPPAREPGLELEVSADANVAVLATKNPNITVLWLY